MNMRLKSATGKPKIRFVPRGLLRVVADVLQRPLVDVEAARDVAVEEEWLGERELIVLRAIARLHRQRQTLAAAEEVRRLEPELTEEALGTARRRRRRSADSGSAPRTSA